MAEKTVYVTDAEVDVVCLRSDILSDFEPARVMSMDEFVRMLCTSSYQDEIDSHTVETLWQKCVDHTRSTVSYQQFVNVISNRRNTSFTTAIDQRDEGVIQDLTKCTAVNESYLLNRSQHARIRPLRLFLRVISSSFIIDTAIREQFVENYNCWPPPLLLLIISLIEIGCFILYTLNVGEVWTNGPMPAYSYFAYRPDKRIEMWRYMCYPLSNSGWIHFAFNISVQLMIGIPLEMVHGSCRIIFIYLSATVAGSLGTSIFDRNFFLVGASGGAYSLLFAQLTFIITNFTRVKISYFPLPTIVILGFADLGYAIWARYASSDQLSYVSHLMGILIGSTLGLVVLKYYKRKLYKQTVWWILICAYSSFVTFAICWNIYYLE